MERFTGGLFNTFVIATEKVNTSYFIRGDIKNSRGRGAIIRHLPFMRCNVCVYIYTQVYDCDCYYIRVKRTDGTHSQIETSVVLESGRQHDVRRLPSGPLVVRCPAVRFHAGGVRTVVYVVLVIFRVVVVAVVAVFRVVFR